MIKKAFDFLSSDRALLGALLTYLALIMVGTSISRYHQGEYFWAFADALTAAFFTFKFWCDWRHKV